MKGVCLTPQAAGVDLTAIILSCLSHLFVTVAADSRGKGGCYAGILRFVSSRAFKSQNEKAAHNPTQNIILDNRV